MGKDITKKFLENCSKNFEKDPQNKLMMNAMVKNGIDASAINEEKIIDNQCVFSQEIDTGKVTNQKQTGRCWMFAGLNTLRQGMIEKYKIKDFELSQCYGMFWDKFEKANMFLENIIDTVDEAIDSRIVMFLLHNPIDDGGEWQMFYNIVEKYGVVPQYLMPETEQTKDSKNMNSILGTKLRQGAMKIRNLHEDGKSIQDIEKEKEEILTDVYRMLCCFLGEPPKKFDFEYRDKDKKFFRFENLTPLEFYKKFACIDVNDYVCVINDPAKDKKFSTMYTIKYLGNVKGGQDIKYLNVDIDTFKELTMKQLNDNEPVWFGCDVEKMMDRKTGIMDMDLYLYDSAFNTDFNMPKGERISYCESSCTHAMVLTGVNIVDGKPNRWKVQNSWGEDRGAKGYFVMSDQWFDEYMYQVVINKKYLSDELKKVCTKKPVVLEPWDPLESLSL